MAPGRPLGRDDARRRCSPGSVDRIRWKVVLARGIRTADVHRRRFCLLVGASWMRREVITETRTVWSTQKSRNPMRPARCHTLSPGTNSERDPSVGSLSQCARRDSANAIGTSSPGNSTHVDQAAVRPPPTNAPYVGGRARHTRPQSMSERAACGERSEAHSARALRTGDDARDRPTATSGAKRAETPPNPGRLTARV
jgi:hypothetical protein